MVPGTIARDPLTPGLRAIILLPLLPIAIVVIVLLAIEGETPAWEYAVIVLIFAIIAGCTMWMSAFIAVREDAVRIGFLPIFWRTIPYRDIVAIDVIEIDPIRDYRGWGIKGRSTQPGGMLFSGGSRHGVRFTLRDDRRYIVTVREPVEGVVTILRERID